MELIPIQKDLNENSGFINDPVCNEITLMTIDFYERVGFVLPWIGYFFSENGDIVGTGGFKGQPVNETVEIAYSSFEGYRNQGVGTRICKLLVELALRTDASLKIIAHTLPENNHSTRILEKNHFEYAGIFNDPEDGEVWQWVFRKPDM